MVKRLIALALVVAALSGCQTFAGGGGTSSGNGGGALGTTLAW